jgi:hypothetical protein
LRSLERDIPSGPLAGPPADCQLFRPTTPVLIARLRGTLAGRLRTTRPAALFRRGKRLLFEVKDGAERHVDLHELTRGQAAREVAEALRVDGSGLLDQYPDILAG